MPKDRKMDKEKDKKKFESVNVIGKSTIIKSNTSPTRLPFLLCLSVYLINIT